MIDVFGYCIAGHASDYTPTPSLGAAGFTWIHGRPTMTFMDCTHGLIMAIVKSEES